LMSTTALNTNPEKVRGQGAAQFTTYSLSIADEDRARLKRISYDRLHELAVSFDDLFTTFEAPEKGDIDQAEKSVVAVGMYFFEENDPNVKYQW